MDIFVGGGDVRGVNVLHSSSRIRSRVVAVAGRLCNVIAHGRLILVISCRVTGPLDSTGTRYCTANYRRPADCPFAAATVG